MSKAAQRRHRQTKMQQVNLIRNEATLAGDHIPATLTHLMDMGHRYNLLHELTLDYAKGIRLRYTREDAVAYAWSRNKHFFVTPITGPMGPQGLAGMGPQGAQGSQRRRCPSCQRYL